MLTKLQREVVNKQILPLIKDWKLNEIQEALGFIEGYAIGMEAKTPPLGGSLPDKMIQLAEKLKSGSQIQDGVIQRADELISHRRSVQTELLKVYLQGL